MYCNLLIFTSTHLNIQSYQRNISLLLHSTKNMHFRLFTKIGKSYTLIFYRDRNVIQYGNVQFFVIRVEWNKLTYYLR